VVLPERVWNRSRLNWTLPARATTRRSRHWCAGTKVASSAWRQDSVRLQPEDPCRVAAGPAGDVRPHSRGAPRSVAGGRARTRRGAASERDDVAAPNVRIGRRWRVMGEGILARNSPVP
jgi:hypothetical protein